MSHNEHRENSPSANANVYDRTGLYIAILALAIAGMALGVEISRSMTASELRNLQEQAIDAKIQAGIERARADMQQHVEQAKSDADAGRTDGRLALDRVEKAVAKLEAKGLIKESH
jgi:hypothetical protein